MKKLLLSLILVLSACSYEKEKLVSNYSALSVDSLSYDFGTIEEGAKTQDKTFVFTKGESSSAHTNVFMESEDFKVVTATGCNRILKKAADKCYVKVRFLKNNTAGDYSGTLLVGESIETSTEVTMTAKVISNTNLTSLTLKEGSENLSWSQPLSFGEVSKNSTLMKTLTLHNENSLEVQSLEVNVGGASYTKTMDTCSSKNLSKNKSCFVRIQVKVGEEDSGDLEGTLTVQASNLDLSQLPLVTEVPAPAVVAAEDLKAYESSVELSNPLSFGTILPSESVIKVLTLKNESTKAVVLNIEKRGSESFKIVSSTCSSSLIPRRSCYLRVSLVGDVVGVKTGEIQAASTVIALSGEVLSASGPLVCEEGYEEQSGSCVLIPPQVTVALYDENNNPATSINLGDVNEGERGSKNLIVKNNGPTQQVLNFGYDGDGWGLNITTCDYGTNSYIINGNSECIVTVYFDNQLESEQDVQAQGVLYFNGQSISLTSNKITDIEWLEIPETNYTAIDSRGWNAVDVGGSKVLSPGYVNHNFLTGDVLSHKIIANVYSEIDLLFVPYGKENYQVLNSQGVPIPQHTNDNGSMIEFEDTINLSAGDYIEIILTFPYAQNNVRIYDDITTSNNGLSFSPALKNGVTLGGKNTVTGIRVIQDYETIVQLSFSRFAFGNENDISLIEGRKIKLKALRLNQVGFMVDESSSLINLPQYIGFPGLNISYQKMFPMMEFGQLGQKFPVVDNEEETNVLSGDHTFLFPQGIENANFQWRFFSTQRVPRTPILKIPLLKNP